MVDFSAGRTIIGGEEYDFQARMAIDHERRILYAIDAIEPLGVMAVSIEDGSQIAMYGGGRGDGPGELRALTGVSLSEEGILMSGRGVINHWGLDGSLIGTWRPSFPDGSGAGDHCALGDQPVIPTQTGLVRRVPDGSWTMLGRRPGGSMPAEVIGFTRVACLDDGVYVLDEQLTRYSLDGRATSVPLPPELLEISLSRQEGFRGGVGGPYSALFANGAGQVVVVLPLSAPGNIFGAIIDPVTGCSTLLAAPDRDIRIRNRLMGMYQDSVMMGERIVIEQVIDGVATPGYFDTASKLVLHPLSPASGAPCPEASGP